MIFKSIKLRNFRQFIKAEIPLDTNGLKNVILIKGENTTGKTSLANAFTWCLFGLSSFKDSVLNRKVEYDLQHENTIDVEVTLCIEHKGSDYYINRRQRFKKNNIKAAALGTSELMVLVKSFETGESRPLENSQSQDDLQDNIKSIFPTYLSDYLILKGEMLSSIEDRAVQNRKIVEFAKAVKLMLQLQPIENAIHDLKNTRKLFVKELQSTDKDKIDQIKTEQERLNNEIDKSIREFEKNKNDIETLANDIDRLNEKIKLGGVDDEKLVIEKDGLDKAISSHEAYQKEKRNAFLEGFPKMLTTHLISQLWPKAKDEIKVSGVEGLYVPGITEKAVNELLKRGVCICGNKLEEGSEARKTLTELLDTIPPKSIGGEIDVFKTYGDSKCDDSESQFLRQQFDACKNDISRAQTEIERATKRVVEITQLLKSGENTSELQNQINAKLAEKNRINDANLEMKENIGKLQAKLEDVEKKLKELTVNVKSNADVYLAIEYVDRISSMLNDFYNKSEQHRLEDLNNKVNEIFLSVFSQKNYKLRMDSTYKPVAFDNQNQRVTLSGAESIFIVLSFISAILNLAMNPKDDKFHAESYPWVLDAPFSNFDSINTASACRCIPNLTGQLIILSKEVDVMKDILNERVSKYYELIPDEGDGNDRFVTSVKEMQI